MALNHLISCTVSSSECIFIKDSISLSSKHISDYLLNQWISNSDISNIAILKSEILPYWTPFSIKNPKISIIDISSDPRNWLNSQKEIVELSSIFSSLNEIPTPTTGKKVLYIESISSLISICKSPESLVSFLNNLKSIKYSSICCIIHTETLDSASFKVLETAATALIEVIPTPLHPSIEISGSLKILQKRKGGKVTRIFEHYKIEENSILLSLFPDALISKSTQGSHDQPSKKYDIDVLTPEQEKARAAVALPYTIAKDYASQSVSGLPEQSLDAPHGSLYHDPLDVEDDDEDDLDF